MQHQSRLQEPARCNRLSVISRRHRCRRLDKEEAPTIADYFSKVGLTNAQISELLVYGDENKADAKATALNFLKTKQDVWRKWVPADVAQKVEAGLR